MYVSYNKILDNCGSRLEANFNKIDEYIGKFEWKKFILPRHVKLLEDYVRNNMDLRKMSQMIDIPVRDLNAIFLRIQSQFELYEANKEAIFAETIEVDAKKNIAREESLRKDKIISYKVNPLTGNKNKDLIIRRSLRKLLDIKHYNHMFSESMLLYIKDLFDGLSVEQIATKRNRNKKYVLYTLVGCENPRSTCEKGLERIIEEYQQSK